jgi:hypothetical protein
MQTVAIEAKGLMSSTKLTVATSITAAMLFPRKHIPKKPILSAIEYPPPLKVIEYGGSTIGFYR